MKKLLFLVPLILIGLSASPYALYKDEVDLAAIKDPGSLEESAAQATSFEEAFELLSKLSPSHWRMLEYDVSASASLENVTLPDDTESTDEAPQEPPKPDPLYENARFYGFPAGAYLTKSASGTTANSSGSFDAKAWSWLWAAVDGGLIFATLVLAILINLLGRKKKDPAATNQVTSTPYAAPPTVSPQNTNQPIMGSVKNIA